MNGMDKRTGKPISGVSYLQQRIDTLMTTPSMTRVMRRNYAGIFNFVDKPINKAFLIDLYAGVAVVINKWEPELKIKQISLQAVSKGKVDLLLIGQYRELGMNGTSAKPRDIKLSTSLSAGQ